MTPTRRKRLAIVAMILLAASAATALAITAFRDNMLYFFSPTELAEGKAPTGRTVRVGGMVRDGSVVRADDSLEVRFDLTDYNNTVTVVYEGILPDLFREGQGIIAIGHPDGPSRFLADEVLAKHDETYMPPEVAELMKGRTEAGQ